jgi:hypothetical protein
MRRFLWLAIVGFFYSPASAVVLFQDSDAAAVVGCGSAIFSSATFTVGADTRLVAYTNDTGDGWVDHPTSLPTSPLMIIDTTDLVRTTATTGTAMAVINQAITCFNYSVQMQVTPNNATSGHRMGPLARMDVTLDQGYEFRLVNQTGVAELRRRDSSASQVLLGSATIGDITGLVFNSTNTYTMKISVDSANIFTCTVNGFGHAALIRTDATYTTGRPGIFATNSGPRGDNWIATYVPTP